MKSTILWGALFAAICSQVQADTAPKAVQPQAANPAATQNTQPAPTTKEATQPQTMNCDYKIPASMKTIDQALVLSWSEKATVQTFDFDPKSVDDQMQKLQSCFTEQGWVGFNDALKKSGNVEAIKAQHLTVSSQIDGQAQMAEAKDNQWKVTLPLQVVYQNDKEKLTQLLDIQLTVGRKITGELGIAQMIASVRKAEVPAPSASNPTTTPETEKSSTTTPATTPTQATTPESGASTNPVSTTPQTTAPAH